MPEAVLAVPTVADALNHATQLLRAADIAEPRLDASLLLAEVLGVDRARLWAQGDRELTAEEAVRFQAYLARRRRRQPVAQIIGRREFWSLPLQVSGDVLDPRPDSETLIEAVLRELDSDARRRPWRIADLGTGSGCLLLALLQELPAATGVGIDISPAALRVAEANAAHLGFGGRCRFVQGDWLSGVTDRFDLIVSNPPYLTTAEMAEVAPEVRDFEPVLALDGGADGLAAYRTIISSLSGRVVPGGRVFLEIGASQARAVSELLRSAGFADVELHRDLAGHPRCLSASGL